MPTPSLFLRGGARPLDAYSTQTHLVRRGRRAAQRRAGARGAAMVFTGIVEEMGTVTTVKNLTAVEGEAQIEVEASKTVEGVSLGDSISVNGTCLTVTELTENRFRFGLAPETLRRTNLGSLSVGGRVNLERSLAADGRFGGHVVQGHVDTTGRILSKVPDKEAVVFKIGLDPEHMVYIVEKGYIAVDGASLTVCDVGPDFFTFMMIDYTQQHVVTAKKDIGDIVNIEVDITGKYIEKIVSSRMQESQAAVKPSA